MDEARAGPLRDQGCEIVVLPNAQGKVELPDLLKELARRGVNEVHVEAGYKLNGSLLHEGLVDELLVYLAPSVLGGSAPGMFHLAELQSLDERHRLEFIETARVGADLRVRARVVKP